MPDKFPRKKFANSKARISKLIQLLKRTHGQTTIALKHHEPLQLLIAVILSAQCTDQQVNKVTPALFARFESARDYARADIKEIEKFIHSTGFYHNKAKSIQGACKLIVEKHGGKVPNTMEELLTLPGVARKTANIVLYKSFGKIEGIAVDTHVRRLSYRLGLTNNEDPNKIEQDLMKLIPRAYWGEITNWLIWHGRKVCFAKKPNCSGCILNKICPSSLV